MLMQINESRSHNKPRTLDHAPSAQRLCRDARYLSLANTHIPDSVEASLGIHYPTTFDHEIKLLSGNKSCAEKEGD